MLILATKLSSMKKYISQILTILPLFFLLVSCTDKSDNTTPPKTRTELLAMGSWKFSAATWGGVDASGALQACQKDNTMIFVSGGTGTTDEGLTKCNAADPQSLPFTWSFLVSETQLQVSAALFTGGSTTFTIVTISETQLVLSQPQTLGGITQTAVVTFVH